MSHKPTTHVAGAHNIRILGMDIHNPVFFVSTAVILAFIAVTLVMGSTAGDFFGALRKSITTNFDWLFMLGGNVFVIFCLFLAASPMGKIVLGGKDAKPDYSRLSWFAMLFAAGMGIGLMFWSVAEPVVYGAGVWGYAPLGVANDPDMALAATIFHWGLHPWAIYAVVALALAFFCYNRNLPLTVRSAFYPLLGEKVWGFWGHVIDTLAVFATIFGLATSLGLGAQQANAGLNYLFGSEISATYQVIIIVIITAIALVSVVNGLDRGVKKLSEFNIVLALLLLVALIVLGPTLDIITSVFSNTAHYLANIVPLSNWVGREDTGFMHDWTTFYWAWWIAWSPFVGMFIARVSKGRTVREFIIGVLIVPTLVSIVWMSAFGNTALEVVTEQAGQLAGAAENSALAKQVGSDYSMAMFAMFESLPASSILSFVGIVLVITFFVTSSDSGSLVIDTITAGGKVDAPVAQRVLWCLLEGLIAIVLLVSGGLGALQAASVATGLPFVIVLLIMCWSVFRGLRQELKEG